MEDNKLLRWIDNIYNGEINEEIVIVNFMYKGQITKINESISNNLKINKFNTILEKKLHEKNCIYCAELLKYEDIKYLVDSDIKIIFLEYYISDHFINDIKNGIFKNHDYFFIEKINFEETIYNDDLKKFIKKRYQDLPPNLDIRSSIYKFILENYDFKLLKENRILTASLAHMLYRMCYLDYTSTKTQVGINISKILNVKSKSLTPKQFKNYLGKDSDQNLKQARVYDLNINQYVFDTKINILKKLIKLNIDTLDFKKIFEIVELSNIEIKEIKDSEIKSYLKDLKKSNTNL